MLLRLNPLGQNLVVNLQILFDVPIENYRFKGDGLRIFVGGFVLLVLDLHVNVFLVSDEETQ